MNQLERDQPEQDRIAELLKHAMPPANQELRRDLWPKMLQRLDQQSIQRSWLAAVFSLGSNAPWFDWALLATLLVGVCLFPRAIPIWLYHF